MKRQNYYSHITVAAVLLVCLAVGSGPAVADEGTPRVVYTTAFVPGARVVLLDNEPDGATGLLAGTSGVVVCCDAGDCSGRVMVSWSTWRGGRDDASKCASAAAELYPTGSTTWVDPAKVRMGLPFDGLGVLRERSEGCLYLETEDGGVYHLMIGDTFRQQWFVVRPGAFFRVRGLVNTSKPAAEQTCDQADGDIYDPIFVASDWDDSINSWDRGPFHNLDRVVLVGESNPNHALDLPRGSTGTIICRNTLGKEQSILVSWNQWDKGGEVEEYINCTQRFGGAFTPGSTWWVTAKDIAKYYESGCGTLEETTLCARGDSPEVPVVGLFVPKDNVYCLPDLDIGLILPSASCKAVGLFTPYEELMGRVTPTDTALRDIGGVIFDSVIIACHVPSCCNPPYMAGDRVKLLVNEPGGAQGLAIGAGGTVICCNPNDPVTPILVSWDNWTGGDDDVTACEETTASFPEKSGLWMACTEITRVTKPDLFDWAEYRRFAPQAVQVGKHLKVNGMIANRGGAGSGPFNIGIYLSTDAEIARTDYKLGSMAMDIDAGASIQLSWLNTVPASVPAGTYYVGWLLDPENRVAEEDETNNMAVIDGQLTVTGQ